jgi:predicted dehydrogenase
MRKPRPSHPPLAAEPKSFNRRTIAMVGRVAMTAAAARAGQRQALIRGDLKAAIIGPTSPGPEGLELDSCLKNREDVELVAIADEDEAVLLKAANHLKPKRTYRNYRELLSGENLHLVIVASRRTDQHHDMALAVIEAGHHVLFATPFTHDLVEADQLNAAAKQAGVQIAVAHPMRLAPNIAYLQDIIAGGLIGRLLEIRAWGKQDQRSGGEDMIVNGTHQFDLMRLFARDPLWCTARVTLDGRDITVDDAFKRREHDGPIAGDEIIAQFAFPDGVHATWTSRHALRGHVGNWAIELHGSAGAARINCDTPPRIYVSRKSAWETKGRDERWEPLLKDPVGVERVRPLNVTTENTRLVDDWINAVRCGNEPAANGENATRALEMALAVYRSALSGQRVPLPLSDRSHPLAKH